MRTRRPRWFLLAVTTLLMACASQAADASRDTTSHERRGALEHPLSFLKPGERLELPVQPSWRTVDCGYPAEWVRPAEGGIAAFKCATDAELRTAYEGYLPPLSTPRLLSEEERREFIPGLQRPARTTLPLGPWRRLSEAEQRSAFLMGASLAQAHVDGIWGDAVLLLDAEWRNLVDKGTPLTLPIVLFGPDAEEVKVVPPRILALLTGIRDFPQAGRRWAEAIAEHEKVSSSSPPLKQSPEGWAAVACELSQLARYATNTGRQMYLTNYID